MLVLARKRGEAIVIGNDITVTVLEVRGDRVKLGFSAPGEVPIHRAELHRKIEDESPQVACNSLPLDIELACPAFQGATV